MAKGKAVINYEICMCCTACIYTCPFGYLEKIDIPRNKQIDAAPKLKENNQCNGCGICAKACPVDAITIE